MSLQVLTQGGGTGGASASIFITGLTEADTVTATKDGKTVKGKWTQKQKLPSGYIQLTHIESTGTQYIDTGIKASSNVDVEIDYFDFVSIGGENVLFGGSNGSWVAQLGLNNSTTNSSKVYAYYNYDGNTGISIKTACKYKLSHGVLFADGVQVYSNTYTAFAYDYNIYLLAQNWVGKAQYHSKLKLRSFKMWEDGELVREFIPTKRNSDGAVGLYDFVNGEFYINKGTGEFIAGTESPDLVYGHNITVKDYGMWTVTATNGKDTRTQDVLVDAAIEYRINLPVMLTLYDRGDQCTPTTGGWSVYACGPNTTNAAQLQNERMYMYSTMFNVGGFSTANTIDMTPYSALKCLYSMQNGSITVGVDDIKNTTGSKPYPAPGDADVLTQTITNGTEQIVEVDITSVSGKRYPLVIAGSASGSINKVDVSFYKVWLE